MLAEPLPPPDEEVHSASCVIGAETLADWTGVVCAFYGLVGLVLWFGGALPKGLEWPDIVALAVGALLLCRKG